MRPRLFLRTLSLEARKGMSYRADFWIQAVFVFTAEFGIVWSVWSAVFDASGREVVGGLTRNAAFVYYVAVILTGKLVRGNELSDTAPSQEIYDGGLTRYLLYPASYLGFKYAQNLGGVLPALLQFLAFGAAFPFLFQAPDVHVSVASLAMGLVSIGVANLLYFLMGWPLQAIAFWADNVWSLVVSQRLLANLLGGVMVPLAVFPGWARSVLAGTPFPHLFSEPALALLGRRSPAEWAAGLAQALAWCAAFALLGRLVFRRGSLRYSGVGI